METTLALGGRTETMLTMTSKGLTTTVASEYGGFEYRSRNCAVQYSDISSSRGLTPKTRLLKFVKYYTRADILLFQNGNLLLRANLNAWAISISVLRFAPALETQITPGNFPQRHRIS